MHRRNRWTSIITMLCLLFSMFVFTTTSASADNGPCTDSVVNEFAGLAHINTTEPIRSARAEIYADTDRFRPCSTPDSNDRGAVSNWVSMEWNGSPNSIFQVGLIKCSTDDGYNASDSPCYGSRKNTLRYFYAWGRDAGTCPAPYDGSHNPRAIDLGYAGEDQWHVFEVIFDPDTYRVNFKIDFVQVASINAFNVCWIDGYTTKAGWRVERWNQNDGTQTGTPLRMKTFYYKKIGSNSWITKTFPSCNSMILDHSDFDCIFFNTSSYGVGIYN